MTVEFLDPLGRGGKQSNVTGGIFWLNLVVLVERADRYSAAVRTTDFEWGEEWRLAFALKSRRLTGVSHSGHRNMQLDG